MCAGPYDNLKDVALKILENEVATVPIIHSSSEDGSFPQLLHLASLSGILKCICRYFRHSSNSLPVLQLPIFAIPVGTWVSEIGEANQRPLAKLHPSASLSSALSLLVQDAATYCSAKVHCCGEAPGGGEDEAR
ncbi:Sucrose nonfermenting 4-like protein [Vitis vinifera]|uniref:Sucrose nonfermenting 4-like protein n=1 Tax=Vitis vinifera TaxID=29760 RepID=A0A438KLH1_VITVI|nr:Sucrose nonfermenting 4-like protein [Vitis vinifera]